MILLVINGVVGFPLAAGTIAALAHVLTGPDHLAAVMPLAVENSKKAWRIGMGWALGHITGMLVIGLLFIAFKQWIPVDSISAHSEALVGFVLVFIGLWAFYRIYRPQKEHNHIHIHTDDKPYLHSHSHHHDRQGVHNHSHSAGETKSGIFSAYLVGTLHGLAGISHFLIFLPALGLESTFDSVRYLIGFGLGTIMAMTLFAFVTGKTAEKTKIGHNSLLFKGLRLAAGSFAIIIGVYWIFG